MATGWAGACASGLGNDSSTELDWNRPRCCCVALLCDVVLSCDLFTRYRPSDAAREAGGFSELPFHGHWLYKSDEDELALEPGSKLFVFPKLKSVPLVALNNCVPIGDSVSEKRLGPDLGAEHEHEFLLSDIRRAKGARGAPPRDIVLILYFTDLEDEDSSDSD